MIPHEPPKCLLLMDFAAKGVPNAHTRVTPWHHTAATESLAIIEDSRSKSLGRTTLRMKCITIFLFSAGVLCAADFTTGQAARLVIGQPTFTSQDSNSSDTILGAASGLAFAADTLFVADSNRVGASPSNHRVLLFQNVSGMLPRPTDQLIYNSKCPVCVGHATVVLGQPDFTTATENLQATPTTLRLPTAVASDGVHVVVADTNHNRVLIWNRIPTSNNAPADVVVGQQSFTTTTVPGNTPSAKSMRGPQGVWIQNGRLYVADTQNNRVLIFNHIPTSQWRGRRRRARAAELHHLCRARSDAAEEQRLGQPACSTR